MFLLRYVIRVLLIIFTALILDIVIARNQGQSHGWACMCMNQAHENIMSK